MIPHMRSTSSCSDMFQNHRNLYACSDQACTQYTQITEVHAHTRTEKCISLPRCAEIHVCYTSGQVYYLPRCTCTSAKG